MRKRVTDSWKKLLAEAKNLSAREVAAFKKALDAYCAQLLSRQEQGVTELRGVLASKPGAARKRAAKRVRRVRKPAPTARKKAVKPVPAKKGAARRGRAGAAEARALISEALSKKPSTIAELVKASDCVRITVDKFIKKNLKAGRIVKAGMKGRAVLYKAK
jgi:hypothetical protein